MVSKTQGGHFDGNESVQNICSLLFPVSKSFFLNSVKNKSPAQLFVYLPKKTTTENSRRLGYSTVNLTYQDMFL